MSALDFGGGTNTNASTQYYTFTGPALPDGDWCIGFWWRSLNALTDGTGNYQTCLSSGALSATNSINIYIEEFSPYNIRVIAYGSDSVGSLHNGASDRSGVAGDGDDSDWLIVLQRRSGNIEIYCVTEGDTGISTLYSADDALTAGFNSNTWYFGTRADLNTARATQNPIGELFVYDDRSLTSGEVESLAAGAAPDTLYTPKVRLKFRDGAVATESNVGSGGATNNATRSTDTGWDTVDEFWADASQTSAPTNDISAGSWVASTGNDLYAMLDEETPSDSDYCIDVSSGSTMEVKFGTVIDPASSTGHKVHYRIKAASGSLVVSLRQGSSTEIASWTHDPAPTTATTYDQDLTGGQADSITDYSDLRLRVVSSA